MRGRGRESVVASPKGGPRTVGRARLALAIIAVVVAGEEGRVDVNLVGDGLAETVAGERHCGLFRTLELEN